jgi:hypothetical protein
LRSFDFADALTGQADRIAFSAGGASPYYRYLAASCGRSATTTATTAAAASVDDHPDAQQAQKFELSYCEPHIQFFPFLKSEFKPDILRKPFAGSYKKVNLWAETSWPLAGATRAAFSITPLL